jgi:peroxiredoxin
MRAYQAVLPDLEKYHATLVAISPELPDNSLTTREKNELGYEVLSDLGNRVARDYGLVFTLDDAVVDIFANSFNIVLPDWNGEVSWELPIPATYVVDQDGVIALAFVEPDYTRRLEPQALLEALAAL